MPTTPNNSKIADIFMKKKGVKLAAKVYKKFAFGVKEIVAVYAQINFIVADPDFIKYQNVYKVSNYSHNSWAFAKLILENL